MDEKTIELMGAMLRSTPEEKKEFWDALGQYCRDNGLEEVWYCPYVPLQTVRADSTANTALEFKTRYGTIKKETKE